MIEDVLSAMGGSPTLTSEERLACQQAARLIPKLTEQLTHIRVAEKHLRRFVEKVARLSGDEVCAPLTEEAADLLEDMYAGNR